MLRWRLHLLLFGAAFIGGAFIGTAKSNDNEVFTGAVQSMAHWYASNMASGQSMKKDASALLQPILSIEEKLGQAPLAIAVLGRLKLFTALKEFRDFALSLPNNSKEQNVNFEFLKWSNSYKASLSQISFDGWNAFERAHLNMYAITQLTSFFPNYLTDAMDAVMLPNDFPEESKKQYIKTAFNSIMKIANKTEDHIVEVVQKFNHTSLAIQEMICAMETTQLDREEAKKLVEILITQRNYTKNAAKIRLETYNNRMEEKKKEAKLYEQKWHNSQEELAKISRLNSEAEPLYETKETPIYETRQIRTPHTMPTKKYSTYSNECAQECRGSYEKHCWTVFGKSEPCSTDIKHGK
jgi:hypothetical protein